MERPTNLMNEQQNLLVLRFLEGVTVLHLSMRDKLDQELPSLIKQTNSFIDEACKKDGKILIHCEQGISRSASIACAWLMHDACKRGENHSFEKMINQIVCDIYTGDRPPFGVQFRAIKRAKIHRSSRSGIHVFSLVQDKNRF